MTADIDPVKIARNAAAEMICAGVGLLDEARRQILAGEWDRDPRVEKVILGARAMQSAVAGGAVRDDYAAICKELGCVEKPGVPLRFIQEMRKSLSAAGERIDWLLRSWDDANITERQELDRMRRGWGPTTPTERMLRHRDLRDCMQALSGALTDLTTPEDDIADPEVEARIQEAYDRVNKRYLASLEILRRLDEPLERPDLEPSPPVASIGEMKTSAGFDYFVMIRCGERECSVFKFADRAKAEYERDHLNWIFGAREEPDLLNYEFATPAPAEDAAGLVERGRQASAVVDNYTGDKCLIRDLTDLIEALQAEVGRLREGGAAK